MDEKNVSGLSGLFKFTDAVTLMGIVYSGAEKVQYETFMAGQLFKLS